MTDVAVSATPAGLSPAPVDALHQQLRTLDFPPPYQRGDKAARHAAVQADAVNAWLFPHTLYAVVPAGLWHGYPPLTTHRLPASAVAFLGSADGNRGWWLHYSLTPVGHHEDGDLVHTITRIAPCDCGAYIDVELPDQDALVVILDELDMTPGHLGAVRLALADPPGLDRGQAPHQRAGRTAFLRRAAVARDLLARRAGPCPRASPGARWTQPHPCPCEGAPP
ncbi:hypothetical protein [Streptomyces flavidovirens]|uniref:DUF402 domain-containing protein n=1 Tax=Streptomyces flavidovirens TaxID=67298 RepID=A0ABW6RNN0_9ACTN